MDSASVLKVLFPKGTWRMRTALLFGFILLDLLVTAALCKTPHAEANLLARSFMQAYGTVTGLVIFDFMFSIPIYFILVLDSRLIRYTGQYSLIAELFVDVALGWLIAGAHFNGAMSWLWDAPNLIRQTIGFGFYLAVAFPMFYLRPKTVLPQAFPESDV